MARLFTMLLALALATGAVAAPAHGDVPPDAIGVNLAGDKVTLSQYKGKAVVLSFWATWCGYCLKELPVLHNIQKAAGSDNVQVLAINTEERKVFKRVTKALESLEIGMLHDAKGDVREAYGVQGIPHLVIIGRDGRIVSVHRGYDEKMLDAIAHNINLAMAQGAQTQ